MLVKRYQGKNEEEAIQKAKADLGPNVMILNIKSLEKKGLLNISGTPKVEVIVALDDDLDEDIYDEDTQSHSTNARTHPENRGQEDEEENFKAYRAKPLINPHTFRDKVKAKPPVTEGNRKTKGSGQSPDQLRAQAQQSARSQSPEQSEGETNRRPVYSASHVSKLYSQQAKKDNQKAISSRSEAPSEAKGARNNQDSEGGLRRHSTTERSEQKTGNLELNGPAETVQKLYQHLLFQKVQKELAQKITKSTRELITGESSIPLPEALNIGIKELIHTSSGLNVATGPAVVALVGPTGVGKTTTIAKLAANFHLKENKNVALITVDTYRIAAIQQLKIYANYIGIPLEIALTPTEMSQLVSKHSNYDLILIDTPGRSQKDSMKIQELKTLLEAAQPTEVHVLLSITTELSVLWDVIKGFAPLEPNRLMFTKLDESSCFGNILNLTSSLKKPISYLTIGQDVPDDIELATTEQITEYLLRVTK